MTETSLDIGTAAVAGLIAGGIALVIVFGMLATNPRTFPFNPLYLAGSAVTIETLPAYAIGLTTWLSVSVVYSVFIAAVMNGFEVTGHEYAWGAATGAVLAVITGTSISYARSISRSVRSGLVGEPGPFLVSYGLRSAAQLVAIHILFGAITSQIYSMQT